MNARSRIPANHARSHAWLVALLLVALFAAVRVVGVLGPRQFRWVLPLGFAVMAILPYVLLNAAARREMGLRLPAGLGAYGLAIVSGAAAAFGCFALGVASFGSGDDNWFVSIANSYHGMMETAGWNAASARALLPSPSARHSLSSISVTTACCSPPPVSACGRCRVRSGCC